MKTIPPLKTIATGIAIAGLATANIAGAKELSFASGTPLNSMGAKAVYVFADAVEEHSEGDVTVKAYIQSLLSFMETPAGLRDGMADLGTVLTPYFPSDFPNTIMLTELTMALELADVSPQDAVFAYTGAVSEYVINNCPACLQEHHDRNQIFLGLASSSPYGLFCNGAITSKEDMEGKRIRIGGPQWSRWVTAMGGSPVSIPVNETYEGLDQGVVDCTAHNLSDYLNFKFIEIASDVTMGVPGGTFGGVGTSMNADAWKGLSEEDRTSVLYGAATIAAEIAKLYLEDHEEALRRIDEQPELTLHEPDEEFRQMTRDFIEQDLKTVASSYAERYDVQQAEARMAEFKEMLDEWVGKVEGIETREELRDLYWKEVFSKVDVTSYGI
ncbi:TRAP-type C4-dicarboxylate transport system, substrate-binding protein [Marinobacter segnicrescens]|uniref:TRAP-type C4-dicarboxylate transport system, substrate-binding protein n=1 Tax=Marinobacter segnicrescens TaxID=430453 RepID=A0A1H9Z844_9GAMM|nr:C4-dicarboxylate TRAP transporter substrate-binding protein [Marinobacter segnicrescens]SES77679.1 TRAP-type C4-dicarboxylate transport system, substrate-binding protein [Marinobacter segnicrescens]